MAETAILADNLTKEFALERDRARHLKAFAVRLFRGHRGRVERFRALDGVSFDVPVGRALGIVGENGSGKSTLLSVLSRILRPTGGRFEVRGRVCTLLELGAGFHPDLTGVENVYLNGVILGLTRREVAERLDSILAFAELEDFADAEVRTYSSGMVTRLGFSIAVHADPDVLLLDEGLSAGDERFNRKCYTKMGELRASGHRTLVLVSHDLTTVRETCDMVLWLHRGKVAAFGDTETVLGRYKAFVESQRTSAATGG